MRCSTPLRAANQLPGFGTLCPRCVLADAAHARPPETPDSDVLFGKLVVEQGLAKPEHVRECLRILGNLADRDVRPMPKLGEILMRKGYLTLDQFNQTMKAAGGTTIQYAPSGTPKAAVPEEVREAAADPANRFGKYLRVSKLGAGGMGEVWKAWDTELGRWVALKFLKGEDMEDVARFSREAQTAAKLNHPNIGAVYEVGERQGKHFIAMQLVAGETLETFPRDDRRLLAELIRDAAIAVHAAHEGRVIHRDLKPANIMVEGTPGPRKKTTRRVPGQSRASGLRVYVMDFGLAKPMSVDSKLSRSGVIVGTPAYMSPEQARGKMHEVGSASDVYSLGATLYELLTDRPLFREKDVYELLRRVIEEEPKPVRKVNARIDPDLETIVMKCLEKDPTRRYATALDLAEDLTRHLRGDAIEAHPPSAAYRLRKWVARRRAVAIPTVAAILLGLAFGTWAVVSAMQRQKRIRVGLARGARLEAAGDVEGALTEYKIVLDLDGKSVAARMGFDRTDAEVRRRKWDLEEAKLYLPLEGKLTELRKDFYQPEFRLTNTEFAKYDVLVLQVLQQMEKSRKSARGWWLIGRCREVLADTDGASDAYDQALKIDAKHASSLLDLGRLRIERANMIRLWGRSYRDRESAARAESDEGVKLVQKGTASRARENMDLDIARAYAGLAQTGAEGSYSAVEMLEKWPSAPFVEEFLIVEAWSKKGEAGIAAADAAIERMPRMAKALFVKGCRLSGLGRLSDAIAAYSTAIDIHPRFAEAWFMRGCTRYSIRDLSGAIEDLEKVTKELRPRMAEAWVSLGLARNDMGKTGAAIGDFTEAIKRAPEYLDAYQYRAKAHEKRNEIKEAISDCENMRDLAAPGSDDRAAAEEALRRLKQH